MTLSILLCALPLLPAAHANPNGKSGVATSGCTCHGDDSDNTTVTMAADATEVDLGAVVNFTFIVENDGKVVAGLNVDASEGELAAGENTRETRGEIVHPEPVEMIDGVATFTFSWTAPDEPATVRVYGAGNACNGDDEDEGDKWNFAQEVEILVGGGAEDTGDTGEDTAPTDTGTPPPTPTCACDSAASAGWAAPLAAGAVAFRRRRCDARTYFPSR